jgi:restriction endonuclease Mrr
LENSDLASCMIEQKVGVSIAETYQIKRVDSDYFIEE